MRLLIRALHSKMTLVALVVSTVLSAGYFLYATQVAGAQTVQDCSANSMIKCGASSPQDLITKIQASPELQAVYSHFNLTPDRYAQFASQAKMGTAYRNGEIKVDGKTVANSSWSIGRTQFSYAQPYVVGGKTYYQSNSTQVMNQDLPVMAWFDSQGKMDVAVLASCGDPMGGNRLIAQPAPSVTCQQLKVNPVSGGTNTGGTNTGSGTNPGGTSTGTGTTAPAGTINTTSAGGGAVVKTSSAVVTTAAVQHPKPPTSTTPPPVSQTPPAKPKPQSTKSVTVPANGAVTRAAAGDVDSNQGYYIANGYIYYHGTNAVVGGSVDRPVQVDTNDVTGRVTYTVPPGSGTVATAGSNKVVHASPRPVTITAPANGPVTSRITDNTNSNTGFYIANGYIYYHGTNAIVGGAVDKPVTVNQNPGGSYTYQLDHPDYSDLTAADLNGPITDEGQVFTDTSVQTASVNASTTKAAAVKTAAVSAKPATIRTAQSTAQTVPNSIGGSTTNTYSFSTDAPAVNGGTVTRVVYDFGDGQTQQTNDPNQVVTHTFATAGTFDVKVTIYAKGADGREIAINGAGCLKRITVRPTPTGSIQCTSLRATRQFNSDSSSGDVNALNNTDYLSYSFQATASGNQYATLTAADFDFGDGNTENGVQPSGTNGSVIASKHTYAAPGTYTARATLYYTQKNADGTADSTGVSKTVTCQTTVAITQPQPPVTPTVTPPVTPPAVVPAPTPAPILPKTGPAGVFSLFTGASALGTFGYQLRLRRRRHYDAQVDRMVNQLIGKL